MKRIIIILLAFLPLTVVAQEFAVANFELREFDLTAINEATKYIDDNNEICALIKIETTDKDFYFDGGTVGIANVDNNHTAEIWVYVPAGLRKISIMHNKYGVIRDYYFPITLVAARTYLMKLRLPNQAQDKKQTEETDSLKQQMAELQRQMQQLMQKQQQGSGQVSVNTVPRTTTTQYSGVEVGNGVLKRVPESFYGHFVIGDDVTEIADYAFHKCDGLKSVTIPNSVTSIGTTAFWGCTSLNDITIPDNVNEFGFHILCRCYGLTQPVYNNKNFIRLPYSFKGGYTIPSGIECIVSAAFEECTGLTNVTIPNSVKVIQSWAFHNCSSLKSVTIPGSVKIIGNNAFGHCKEMTNVTINEGVETMEFDAFLGCKSLTSVSLPSTLTKIDALYGAFFGCRKLTAIYVPIGSKEKIMNLLPKRLRKYVIER